MNELKLHRPDNILNVAEQKVKKELKFIGKQNKIPNLILWEYNSVTKELNRATYNYKDVVLDFSKPDPAKDYLKRCKVITKPNCKYFQALNEENAWKKINQGKI